MNQPEFILAQQDAACAACNEQGECSGLRWLRDEAATVFYGRLRLVLRTCDKQRDRERQKRIQRLLDDSRLPTTVSATRLTREGTLYVEAIRSYLDRGESCLLYPGAGANLLSCDLVLQAVGYNLVLSGKPVYYLLLPMVCQDRSFNLFDIEADFVCLSGLGASIPPFSFLQGLSSFLSERIANHKPLVVSTPQDPKLARARNPAEQQVYEMVCDWFQLIEIKGKVIP